MISDDHILAYLHEELPLAESAAVERAMRDDAELRRRAAIVARRHESAMPTVGSVWRTERVACPDRSQLGAYLLGTLDEGWVDYIGFHTRIVGCRYCLSNLADLQTASVPEEKTPERRRRYFESSAGRLPREESLETRD